MQTTLPFRQAAHGGLASCSRISLLIVLVLIVASCAKRDLRPLNPCTVSASSEELNVLPAEDIDLLFVVDNSNSMREEQAALQAEIGVMVRTLIDQDAVDALAAGEPELEGAKAVKRLRVGTISTDIGVAGFGTAETLQTIAGFDGFELARRVVPGCGVEFSEDGQQVVALHHDRMRTGDRGVINLEPVQATIESDEGSINCGTDRYPGFLAFDAEEAEGNEVAIQEFVDDVSCLTVLGINGCGFEMQLESMLIAVTPSTSTAVEIAEVHGGSGVADLPYPDGNAGFLRDEAILAIIMITDEDDCSTPNPEVFNQRSTQLQDPEAPFLNPDVPDPIPFRFNTRCTVFEHALYPIGRYVEGLLAVKGASRLIFAGIVGVPDEAVDPTAQRNGTAGFDAILQHPEMEVRDSVDPSEPDRWVQLPGTPSDGVLPACWRCLDTDGNERADIDDYMDCPAPSSITGAGLQYAVPARRIVEVARGLREQRVISVIETVCQASYSDAITNILKAIILSTKPSCLGRELNPDAAGMVTCNFLETLPADSDVGCADLDGRESTPFKIENGREVCRIIQRVPTAEDRAFVDVEGRVGRSPEGFGWYYDDFSTETEEQCGEGNTTANVAAATVRFTVGTLPSPGSILRIDCLQPAQGEKDINTPCVDDVACSFEDEDALNAFVVRWNLDASRFTVGNQPMYCEASSNTCQIGCANDSECPGGMVCLMDEGDASGFCLDPTCSQS